ncbi:hypothetical protein M408DRAFT_310561 [Serendipita vermifera MAFF 305830]|uniref:Uncharacterized protein n=1 Tax=Serendipita vermifera MAFF 305830 TaxID=933852 RepID=A0A0C3B6G5_SERVB|nr:hypothetical protein M408DRAFT_310561 [Serendipita vermifera MAFF 305830]
MATGIIQTLVPSDTWVQSVVIRNPILNLYNSRGKSTKKKKKQNIEIWNRTNATTFNDNNTTGIAGSFSPVTIDLSQVSELEVSIYIDQNLVGIPFFLNANLGSDDRVLYTPEPCTCTTAGHNIIYVVIEPSWSSKSFPWGLAGDFAWGVTIVSTKQTILINSSRLEIYALTNVLPAFFKNRIEVIFLRKLPKRMTGHPTSSQQPSKTSGYSYDTIGGKSHFGLEPKGGNFDVTKWTLSTNRGHRVNCYDQAASVQTGLGLAPGPSSMWHIMAPYGYIRSTNLIGVGQCNNPFYERKHTKPMIGNNDPNRTNFKNHAFVETSGHLIADACAGPHLATQTLDAYVLASIEQPGDTESTTTLYNDHPDYGPGTSVNAKITAGVTSLNIVIPLIVPPLTPGEEDITESLDISVKAAMERATILPGRNPAITFTNADLTKIDQLVRSHSNAPVVHHSNRVSTRGSALEWVLQSPGNDPTCIEVVVLASARDAKNYFASYLRRYQAPLEEIFIAPSPGPLRAMAGLCLVSPQDVNHGHAIWVVGNVFAYLNGPMSVEDLYNTYIKEVNQSLIDGASFGEANPLRPVVSDIQGPRQVKVGEEFSLNVSVSGSVHSSVDTGDNDTVVLVSQDPYHSFQFLAEQEGKQTLGFAFAHATTGFVVTEFVEINVVSEAQA